MLFRSEEKENLNPLVEDVKRAIIDFCNREYEENHSYDEFNTLYPDLKHIGIAYTNTPDEKHEIQFELNLEDFTATQLVNGKEISRYDYAKENGSEEKALEKRNASPERKPPSRNMRTRPPRSSSNRCCRTAPAYASIRRSS